MSTTENINKSINFVCGPINHLLYLYDLGNLIMELMNYEKATNHSAFSHQIPFFKQHVPKDEAKIPVLFIDIE